MNRFELLAFVITPSAVAALGWGAAVWATRHGRSQTPAEWAKEMAREKLPPLHPARCFGKSS